MGVTWVWDQRRVRDSEDLPILDDLLRGRGRSAWLSLGRGLTAAQGTRRVWLVTPHDTLIKTLYTPRTSLEVLSGYEEETLPTSTPLSETTSISSSRTCPPSPPRSARMGIACSRANALRVEERRNVREGPAWGG